MTIKSITFTHDIDRSYLLSLQNSKKTLRQSKTHSHLDILENVPEKPDLIRRKRSLSDDEHQEKPQPVIDTVTDVEGLKQFAENSNNKRQIGYPDHRQGGMRNNIGHFSPAPPGKSLQPRSPRQITIHANPIPENSRNHSNFSLKNRWHHKKQVCNDEIIIDD